MAVRVQADYAATGRTSADTVPAIILTDAYAQLVLRDSAAFGHLHPALVVGQFKTPFALEFLTSFALLQTVNRSQAVDRLAPRRDIGVLGQFVSTRRVLVQSAIVNGEGQNRAANIDGREMLMGRITVFPIARLAIAAKYLGQGGDHRWGYDARWIGRRATVEGEFLARRGPFSAGTTIDARGGYVLVSYKARPWLQPVFRWEELHDSRTSGTGTTSSRLDYTTVGLNVVPAGERIRFVVNYIFKSERPIPTGDEAVAQLIALF